MHPTTVKDQLGFTQRLGFLCLVVFYGIFGSSSPDNLGTVEFLVFLSLTLIIGINGFITPLKLVQNKQTTQHLIHYRASPLFWLFLLFIWGTISGICTGLINGNSMNWIIRDYASFGMLCIPLFFIPHLHKPKFLSALKLSLIGIATFFSLRVIYNIYIQSGNNDTGEIGALYLSISPEILFTACYMVMILVSLVFLYKDLNKAERVNSIGIRSLKIIGSSILSLLTLYVLYTSQMRAGIGAIVLSLILLNIWIFLYRPKRFCLIALVGIITLFILMDPLLTLLTPLIEKQNLVGFNQRFEEFNAVSKQMGPSAISHIIGLGWGAGIESPASAGMYVNFTHNLFSSLWLKTGIIGVILMLIFVTSSFIHIFNTLSFKRPSPLILAIALLLCLFINMLLYGGYKSLGFGLCFTLLLSLYFSQETIGKHSE